MPKYWLNLTLPQYEFVRDLCVTLAIKPGMKMHITLNEALALKNKVLGLPTPTTRAFVTMNCVYNKLQSLEDIARQREAAEQKEVQRVA
jgi:hypothetical protein